MEKQINIQNNVKTNTTNAMAVKRPKKAKKKAQSVVIYPPNAAKNLSVEAQFAQKLAHAEPTMRDRVRKNVYVDYIHCAQCLSIS